MLIHIAYSVILISFLVRDVLWLRLLSIIGGVLWVTFFAIQTPINSAGIAWNVFFSLINLWYILQLIVSRRPVQLNERERALKHQLCPDLSDRRWADLLELGERISPEGPLTIEGELPESVYLITRGSARSLGADPSQERELISTGAIIGGVSYLTGRPAREGVECELGAEVVRWSMEKLRAHLNSVPEALAVFQRLFGEELARHKRLA